MTITALPTTPSRSDTPANFVTKADAFIASLPQFVGELNAMGTAYNLAVTTTSVTSNSVSIASKTFTVASGLGFVVGMSVSMASTASPTNNMFGTVTSYSGTTLIINATSINGTGTFTAWTIALAAASAGAGYGANTFTGTQTLSTSAALNEGMTTLASSATPDIWTSQSNVISYTGTTTATGFAAAPQAGVRRILECAGACAFIASANMLINGVASGQTYTATALDQVEVTAITTTQFRLNPVKQDGTAVITPSAKLQSVTATQSGGALTFGLNPTVLDFRSTTLTNGVPTTVSIPTALTLALPSGGTLGFVTTIQGRMALLAINNAGTAELAVVSLTGGNDLTETGTINTTAISASSTANNVFYSTTARTGVAYRIVGFVDAVNTAGAWAAPVLVQGIGGQALAALSSLGYGQTWQNLTGSRATGTTYYNTTGKPIEVLIGAVITSGTLTVGSMTSPNFGSTTQPELFSFTVPPNQNYSVTGCTSITWLELR